MNEQGCQISSQYIMADYKKTNSLKRISGKVPIFLTGGQ